MIQVIIFRSDLLQTYLCHTVSTSDKKSCIAYYGLENRYLKCSINSSVTSLPEFNVQRSLAAARRTSEAGDIVMIPPAATG